MSRREDQAALGELLLPPQRPGPSYSALERAIALRICAHAHGWEGCRCAGAGRRACAALERAAGEILALLPISAEELERLAAGEAIVAARRGKRGARR